VTSVAELEGIARDIHESTGSRLPVDAFALAELCGLTTRPWSKADGSWTPGTGEIWYPGRARPVRQHGLVAHELGHWALWDAREDHTVERCARYLAGALMLPWQPFTRDVAACDWDLFDLQDRHPNVSAEMVVVRMTQTSESTAWVWDDGRVKRRYGVDDDTDVDELVDQVLAGGEPVRDGELRGWPLLERMHRRVVVVRVAA
jgi:hypothetical protein